MLSDPTASSWVDHKDENHPRNAIDKNPSTFFSQTDVGGYWEATMPV